MARSNGEMQNLAGNWDLVKEVEGLQNMQIHQVNPWVVEIAGSTDRTCIFDTQSKYVEFSINGVIHYGYEVNQGNGTTAIRMLVGRYGPARKRWVAEYIGP